MGEPEGERARRQAPHRVRWEASKRAHHSAKALECTRDKEEQSETITFIVKRNINYYATISRNLIRERKIQ